MPEVIRNGRVEADDWNDSEVLTLAQWKERRGGVAPGAAVAVRLEPADDPAEIAADVERLHRVAVHFPRFADGRGYSLSLIHI